MSPRALIADDEAELAAHLQRELARAWPELEIVGVAPNGAEALALLQSERPDIAFLDIRMPGLTGLEVAEHLGTDCRIVFVTAYDQYAIQAFEREAVDYLLKPVTAQRLAKTVQRLRQNLAAPGAAPALGDLLARLEAAAKPQYLQWIRAGLGERVQLIGADEVIYFKAGDKYTSLFTRTNEFTIRTPIKELAEQLDPQRFWQVHRGTIVNVGRIAAVHREFGGRLSLALKDRPEHLTVSRAYAPLFRQM